MPNNLHPAFRMRLSQMLFQSALLAGFSLLSVLGGVAPQVVPSTPTLLSFDSVARAQSFSPEEISNYAKAVLAIERVRKPALNEFRRMLSSSSSAPPAMICNQSDSTGRLPAAARRIFVGYCQQSKTIVETNGLTPNRFNEITTLLRSNPDLQQKVRTELIRLQK